jgi:hypothetical protein
VNLKTALCFALVAAAVEGVSSCSSRTATAPEPVQSPQPEVSNAAPPQKPKAPAFPVERFSTAAEALSTLLDRTNPTVLGIGELHQQNDTVSVRSALRRFTEDLLPVVADRTADLIVETWVSTGQCGETEKKLAEEVSTVTQRPAATEDETVTLIKAAVAHNIQPRVLEMSCDNYKRIYEADGGTDYLLLLETVGDQLRTQAEKARADRKNVAGAKPMTVLYSGAIHNDAVPEEMWKSVTYGPALAKAAGSNRYLELDVIVPEFAATSKVLKDAPWMETVRTAASPTGASLVRLADRSYLLIFPAGVSNESPNPEAAASSAR